jgi:hypothetical protein
VWRQTPDDSMRSGRDGDAMVPPFRCALPADYILNLILTT